MSSRSVGPDATNHGTPSRFEAFPLPTKEYAMSGTTDRPSTDPAQGPSHTTIVQEVQGFFPNDATLQVALGELTLVGYDRADFSLPEENAAVSSGTPTEGADNPTDSTDKAQLRTLGTGMAGYLGAVAVAGATIATGGAAGLAIAAAAAVGVGGAAAAEVVGQAADKAQIAARDRQGADGKLILAVRIRTPEQGDQVADLMSKAGAMNVEQVSRTDKTLTAGYSAASWTGG